jgi:hypothetical protein
MSAEGACRDPDEGGNSTDDKKYPLHFLLTIYSERSAMPSNSSIPLHFIPCIRKVS